VVRKYIRTIDPRIYIVIETEIWPNLLRHLFARRVPVVLVNGRISDKSFGRYKALRFLFGNILRQVDMFCMQSSRDAERVHALGALLERICVTGSMKFDDKPQAAALRREDFGFGERERIWVAGSTHPGEEEIVLDVYQKLKREFSDLRLAIAPRHVERAAQIEKLIKASGFEAVRFSQPSSNQKNTIVVVDVIGQLRSLYQLAAIVFMGKSFKVHGGQNIIEPACFAKPIVTGPFTENFADVMRIFSQDQAVVQVRDETELLSQMRRLLQNPQEAEGIGRKARDVVERQRGATEKTLDIISRLI
jgi:3-deoxy-D-manno-octulosonic-acid transferase